MRIAGEAVKVSDAKLASIGELLQWVMFAACAYDNKPTKSAEKTLHNCITEISQRCGTPLTVTEIEEIIRRY